MGKWNNTQHNTTGEQRLINCRGLAAKKRLSVRDRGENVQRHWDPKATRSPAKKNSPKHSQRKEGEREIDMGEWWDDKKQKQNYTKSQSEVLREGWERWSEVESAEVKAGEMASLK